MLVRDIGEFGLIEYFRRHLRGDSSVILGSGDDCSVLRFSKDKYQLFTCDMIVEGVDFTLQDNPYLIGRKSIAVNISDIVSCGGIPRHCLISLGLPPKVSFSLVDKIFKGALKISKKYNINIVGGDISRSQKLSINVSMLGEVKKKALVLRNGAKKEDIIFVTGRLGGSISGKHFKFTPRVKESEFLVRNFKINAMIDVSDGIIQDLGHILKQSRVGAVVYEGMIPISNQAKGLKDALYSGEDFELLFTMPERSAEKLLKIRPKDFTPIGRITDRRLGLRLIDKKNKEKSISLKGFRHF